jgi:integrase
VTRPNKGVQQKRPVPGADAAIRDRWGHGPVHDLAPGHSRPAGPIYIPRVKGSVSKTDPLRPEDLRRLRAYLRTRKDDSPALFISNRSMPLERRSYWDLMQTYGEWAGIAKAKGRFHALRHAIAVHLLDAGADVAFVQDRLGHANIQTTMVYMRYTTVTRDAQTRQLFASHRVV